MVKNLKVVSVETVYEEEHYIVQSYKIDEDKNDATDFDKDEIKGNMKKEASKPLHLRRI